jgi:hypothetical protein
VVRSHRPKDLAPLPSLLSRHMGLSVRRSDRSALPRGRCPESRKWEERSSTRNRLHRSEATEPSSAVRRRTTRYAVPWDCGHSWALLGRTRDVRAWITCTSCGETQQQSREWAWSDEIGGGNFAILEEAAHGPTPTRRTTMRKRRRKPNRREGFRTRERDGGTGPGSGMPSLW